jgi:hypothetical protein
MHHVGLTTEKKVTIKVNAGSKPALSTKRIIMEQFDRNQLMDSVLNRMSFIEEVHKKLLDANYYLERYCKIQATMEESETKDRLLNLNKRGLKNAFAFLYTEEAISYWNTHGAFFLLCNDLTERYENLILENTKSEA